MGELEDIKARAAERRRVALNYKPGSGRYDAEADLDRAIAIAETLLVATQDAQRDYVRTKKERDQARAAVLAGRGVVEDLVANLTYGREHSEDERPNGKKWLADTESYEELPRQDDVDGSAKG